jgi:hypothetical protein
MSIAFDTGSYRFLSLRRDGGKLVARSNRSVYSVLPDTVAHQQILQQAGLKFSSCEDGLLLLGDAAHDSSDLFKVRCRPLLPAGRVPKEDPLARQLIGSLTESVLPKAKTPGELCCFTVPGGADLSGESTRPDVEFLLRIIRLQGYQPQIVPASLALVLSQLVENAFTGIGMVFGSSGAEALLAHRGEPICHARVDIGGEWVDEQLSARQKEIGYELETGERFLNTDAVQRRRESVGTSLVLANSAFEQELVSLLHKVVSELIESFMSELALTPRAASVPTPLPVVCSGGLARTVGFDTLVAEVLREAEFPLDLRKPQIIEDAERSIPRGLLINAELEATSAAA